MIVLLLQLPKPPPAGLSIISPVLPSLNFSWMRRLIIAELHCKQVRPLLLWTAAMVMGSLSWGCAVCLAYRGCGGGGGYFSLPISLPLAPSPKPSWALGRYAQLSGKADRISSAFFVLSSNMGSISPPCYGIMGYPRQQR